MRSCILSLLWIWPLFFTPARAEMRDWTSADGSRIRAELLDFNPGSGKVSLRRADGRQFTFTQDRLSEDDRAFLAVQAREKAEKAEKERELLASLVGQTRRYTSSGPEAKDFHVYYPTKYSPDDKRPMLILFDPGGNGAGILGQFREAAEEHGWIAVGCDFLKNGQDRVVSDRAFTEMLLEIEKIVTHHDPNRLYLGGMSGGAARAFIYSAKFERPWKGVLSCGGWLGGRDNYELKFPRKMAVAFVNGDDDLNANSHVTADTEVLKKRSARTKHILFPGGHVVAPPPVLSDAIAWLAENTRD